MSKFSPKAVFSLIVDSVTAFGEDKAGTFGAALAYYTIFSLAPFLIIVIMIAGVIFGHDAVQGHIMQQISGLIGDQGATAVQGLLQNVYSSGSKGAASIIGIVALILGSIGVFLQLQTSLNFIWHVEPASKSTINAIKNFFTTRITSFTLILGIGFLLMVSLVVSAAIHALSGYLSNVVPGMTAILQILDFIVSFLVITGLFAMIFKYLPDADIMWKDALIGAAVTSLLFTLGKIGIGIYLGRSNIGSTFGAASSLIIILLWTYYSAQILLFGAEFTKIYANRYGSKIAPDPGAVRIDIRKIEPEKVLRR